MEAIVHIWFGLDRAFSSLCHENIEKVKQPKGANQMYGKPKNYQLSESKIMTEPNLKKLIKTIKPAYESAVSNQNNLHVINDYFMILVASMTGLRVSELVGLKLKQVGNDNLEIIGKRNFKRLVPLGRRTKKIISELLEVKRTILDHKMKPEDNLFLSKRRKPFTRQGANKRLKLWCRIANIREYSFHSTRHYFATYCLNAGFNLVEVQRFLGHQSPTTTSIYLHFTQDTRDRIDKLL